LIGNLLCPFARKDKGVLFSHQIISEIESVAEKKSGTEKSYLLKMGKGFLLLMYNQQINLQ
jgi:hypothetical protein